MADYYTAEQLAGKLEIIEGVLSELESKGLLQPRVKGEKRFYSSRQAHDLQVALRLARKQKVSLEQAFARIEDLRLCQTGPTTT
jgi:DNA-binding transcriptional MerR regulator